MPSGPPAAPNRAFDSSEAVFTYLREEYGVDGDGDMNAIALFAYALVEKDRVDWCEHVTALKGTPPNAEQTVDWFRQKPESYFRNVEEQAFTWFYAIARSLLREEIEDEQRAAIARAVGNLGRFWPGFWTGNLIGVTSNVLFTCLVVLFVVFISSDFSFIAWAKRLFGLH